MSDNISRQATIDAVNGLEYIQDYVKDYVNSAIAQVPSTDRTGHWRKITAEEDEEMAFMGWVECSNCKAKVVLCSDFCPDCGADMRGEGDERK